VSDYILPDKRCTCDPLPIRVLKEHIDELVPFVLELFDHSSQRGVVSTALKAAFVSPLLKKPDLDPTDAVVAVVCSWFESHFDGRFQFVRCGLTERSEVTGHDLHVTSVSTAAERRQNGGNLLKVCFVQQSATVHFHAVAAKCVWIRMSPAVSH